MQFASDHQNVNKSAFVSNNSDHNFLALDQTFPHVTLKTRPIVKFRQINKVVLRGKPRKETFHDSRCEINAA